MKKEIVIGLVVAAIITTLVVIGMMKYADSVREAADLKSNITIEQAKAVAAEKRVNDIAALVKVQNDALEKLKEIKTPQQAEHVIHDYLPLPSTATVLPNAPSANGEPQHSVAHVRGRKEALGDFGISCKQCQNALDGKNKTLAEKEVEIKSLTKQRDDALAADNGGSKVRRFFKKVKVIGCAGLGAGIGATANGGKGGAIGAVAGATLCSLF
jgi:hypothetical protein